MQYITRFFEEYLLQSSQVLSSLPDFWPHIPYTDHFGWLSASRTPSSKPPSTSQPAAFYKRWGITAPIAENHPLTVSPPLSPINHIHKWACVIAEPNTWLGKWGAKCGPTSTSLPSAFWSMPRSVLQFSRSVVSDSLRRHEPQDARPPCPSPTPGVHPNPCPLCRWCHPTISSYVVPFSSCPQSFPASGSFQMSQLSPSCGQSIRISASASVFPMNTQDWSPLGWTCWNSLQSKGLSRVFSNTTVGAGALGRPRGMVRRGRREEGSGWGTHVYLWRIHFNIWQNQYNIVKF